MEKERYINRKINEKINNQLTVRDEAQKLLQLLLEKRWELVSLVRIDDLDLRHDATSLIPFLIEEWWEIEQICKFKKWLNKVIKRFFYRLIN